MPQVSNELGSQYWESMAIGPVAQADISAWSALGVPSTVPATGSWNSNLLRSDGFKMISVGATSSQAGTLSIQRYLDAAGLVAQGAAVSQSLSAGTPAVVNVVDGLPCQTFKITITNSSGSVATITNFACLLNAA